MTPPGERLVSKIIDWSLDNPFVVMLLAVVLLGVGAMSMASLPLDAVPDLTNTRALKGIPAGMSEIHQFEVNTFGGELTTDEVQVDPNRLLNYGISLGEVFAALEDDNGNAGGGAIRHGAEQRLIRAEGLIGSLDDVCHIVLAGRADGTPIRVSDIGEVGFAPMLRQEPVTRDGDRSTAW